MLNLTLSEFSLIMLCTSSGNWCPNLTWDKFLDGLWCMWAVADWLCAALLGVATDVVVQGKAPRATPIRIA